ncbi:MAG: ATP phosphoribosyltransferase regulatory subunit, partial [Anaerolineae bacterium]|nr:ATP phosphoribosyltransferase regulatory subunit [Anaerolineae bacterium]
FEERSGDDQHYSIGAELIGMSDIAAEAEIIALAANGIAAEATVGSKLVIGHAQLMRVLLKRFKLDSRTQRFLLHHLPALKETGKAFVLDQLDQLLLGRSGQDEASAEVVSELSTQQMLDVLLDATQRGVTMGGRTRHDIVRRLLEKRQRATERGQVVAALDFLEAWSAIDAEPEAAFSQIERLIAPDDAEASRVLAQWRAVIALLDAYGIPASRIQIQPALARSWDYYTGIVFELWTENGYHVGGGGRYDELARLIGGERNVPAVGFAYYVDQLLAALPEASPDKPAAITIAASSASYPDAIRWAQALRQRGQVVVLQDAASACADAFIAQPDGSLHRANHIFTNADQLLAEMEVAR